MLICVVVWLLSPGLISFFCAITYCGVMFPEKTPPEWMTFTRASTPKCISHSSREIRFHWRYDGDCHHTTLALLAVARNHVACTSSFTFVVGGSGDGLPSAHGVRGTVRDTSTVGILSNRKLRVLRIPHTVRASRTTLIRDTLLQSTEFCRSSLSSTQLPFAASNVPLFATRLSPSQILAS